MLQPRSRNLTIIAFAAQVIVCLIAGTMIVASMAIARVRSPGIDEIGGISLTYSIKKTDATRPNGHLATDVAEVLKKRIDPNGVKNIIWRPEGDWRLEIQVPLSAAGRTAAETHRKMRVQMAAAADSLIRTNVDADSVVDAIENRKGKSQADLPGLAGDSATRQKLFAELAKSWNAIQQAHDARDALAEAAGKIEFQQKLHPLSSTGNPMPSPIEDGNLTEEDLQSAILADASAENAQRPAESNTARTDSELGAIRQKFSDFPSRLKAINLYVDTYSKLAGYESAPDDATTLKRLLKGSGVLEFHILALDPPSGMTVAQYGGYVDRLHADGPVFQPGDEAQWFVVDRNQHVGHMETYGRRSYVLAFVTPGPDGKPRGLDATAPKPWHFTNASVNIAMTGERVVSFSLDPQGAAYFGDLTSSNLKKPVAIILDGKMISAPVINGRISANGEIDGGAKGFTPVEATYLADTLKSGSLPAELSDEPTSQREIMPQAPSAGSGLLRQWHLVALLVVAVWLVFSVITLVSVVRSSAPA